MLRVIRLGERDSPTPVRAVLHRGVLHQVSQGLLVAAVTAGETHVGQVSMIDPGNRRLRSAEGVCMTAVGDGACFT